MKLILTKGYFTIQTSLSEKEIMERLKQNVGKRRMFFFNNEKDFEGEVHSYGFDIREAVGYNCLFLPVFHGKFEIMQGNVLINVRVSNMLAGFGTLWGWAWALGLIFVGVRELQGGSDNIANSLGALGSGIFCAVLAVWFAWFYQRKLNDGRKWLKTLLGQ